MKNVIILLAVTYVCGARSLVGRYYYATGAEEAVTQAAALKDCQDHSAVTCYATGCKTAQADEKGSLHFWFDTEEVARD